LLVPRNPCLAIFSRPPWNFLPNTNVTRDATGAITGTQTFTSTSSFQNTTTFDPKMHAVRLGIVYAFN
jgi:hypothetical protein